MWEEKPPNPRVRADPAVQLSHRTHLLRFSHGPFQGLESPGYLHRTEDARWGKPEQTKRVFQRCQQPSGRQCCHFSLPSSPNYSTTPRIRQSSVSFEFSGLLWMGEHLPGMLRFLCSCFFPRQCVGLQKGRCPHGAGWWGFSRWDSAPCCLLKGVCLLLTLRVTWHLLLKPVADLPLGKTVFPGNRSLFLPGSLRCHFLPPWSLTMSLIWFPAWAALVTGLICLCQVDLLFRSSQTLISLLCPLLMACGQSGSPCQGEKVRQMVLSWQFSPEVTYQFHWACWPELVT